MECERVYYHVVFTITRGKPVFLDEEIDAAFKQLAREIASEKEWTLIELETMPNHVHLLLEKALWQDLCVIIGQLKGITARRLLRRFEWLRGELDSWNRGFHYTRHADASTLPGLAVRAQDQDRRKRARPRSRDRARGRRHDECGRYDPLGRGFATADRRGVTPVSPRLFRAALR